MLDVTNRSRVDLSLVERESRLLLSAFAHVLRSCGHASQTRVLPLVGDGSSIDDARALDAVTLGFHLISVAEQHATMLHRREALSKDIAESGLMSSTLHELRDASDVGALAAHVERLHIEPVLTAHPTEARRVSALEQWIALSDALGTDELAATPTDDLLIRLERLFRTGETRLRKPTLADERAVVVHIVTQVIAPALDALDRGTKQAFAARGLTPPSTSGALRFSTWVGGDRDGHPFVTSEVTAESLRVYAEAARAMHGDDLRALRKKLSISTLAPEHEGPLASALSTMRGLLKERADEAIARNPEELYRAFVSMMIARLEDDAAPWRYRRADELLADLALLRSALAHIGAERLAAHDVDPIARRVAVFGFHLVRLDVRQNSATHDRAIEALASSTRAPLAFAQLAESDRRAHVLEAIDALARTSVPSSSKEAEPEALSICTDPLRVLARHRSEHGSDGLGHYIVSMTRDASDLLAPYALAARAGLVEQTPDGPALWLHVVPLFETLDDLRRAPDILSAYLSLPLVTRSLALQARAHGRARPLQQIMVGYSDSNKDGGPTASLVAVHVAQRALLDVAERHGVALRFFHGRGGSTSRGAGPTFRFLSALPTHALDEGLRLTEQGETIFQKYGTKDGAAYNLELLVAGAARRSFIDARRARVDDDEPALREALSFVAESSRQGYRALVEAPGFVSFFRQATPIDVIEQSGIGSRPSRRMGNAASLDDLRAIPWVFAWAQSRAAITGWYGFGTGMAALAEHDAHAHALLCRRALDWPLMRYVVANVGVSVLSVDSGVAALYAALVDDERLREETQARIGAELDRTRDALERIYGAPLPHARQRIAALMALRAPTLRAVHERQIRLLEAWRKDGRPEGEGKTALLATLNAIAAGLRTTG